MKQVKYFLLVAAVALSVFGCRKTIEVSFENATQDLDAQGGSIELALKSNGEWTLSTVEDWITIEPMSGNGDATLTLTAQANTTGESRSTEITATTKDNAAKLTVTQNALEYYLSVTPKEIVCGTDGGVFSVSVSSNVEWDVLLPQWITSSMAHGSNDAIVTLTVSPLEEGSEETRMYDVCFGNPFSSSGTISVTDYVHVVQTADPILDIELTPNSLVFVCTGETKTVAVATEDGWTAVAVDDWVTLSQTEGQGDAEIGVTVEENPFYRERRSIVHFVTSGGIQTDLIIHQEATPDPHFLEVSPLDFEFGKEGGEREITIGCDTVWEFDLNCEWLSLSQMTGSGNATVVLTAEQNDLSQSRVIEFRIKSGGLSYMMVAEQAAGDIPIEFSFDPDTVFVAYIGGVQHVQLNANTSWQLQASSWITLATATSGEGNASIDIIVDGHTDSADRIGTVKAVHDGQVMAALVVVQEGKPNILETDVSQLDVRPEGGSFEVHVTANQTWRIANNMEWIHCNPLSGSGDGVFTLTVDPLSSSEPRVGSIKINGSSGAFVVITVDQH